MRKWILLILPVLFFAGCNNDEIDKETREKMHANIVDYLVNEGIGGANVEIEEYSKVDLPLNDIKEYARLQDSLSLYEQRYEELEAHEEEGKKEEEGEEATETPMLAGDDGRQRCDGHDEQAEEYAGMIGAYEYRIAELEKKYTKKNYIAKAVLRQGKIGKCTPVWFYFDSQYVVMAAYFFEDEVYTCY